MSANVSRQQQSTTHPQQIPLFPESYEEHMTWRIRWYLITTITIAYAASLLAGFTSFALTKDAHYLLFVAPTILIPFVRYLVPMDKKRYELELTKIQAKHKLAEANAQIYMLKQQLDQAQKHFETVGKSHASKMHHPE